MAKKKIITTEEAPLPVGPYSQAVKANGFLFLSGSIPLTPEGEVVEGDVSAQTRQALENIKKILKEAGLSKKSVVKATVFLVNMDDFAAMNEVYAEFFDSNPPARSTIEISRLPKNVKVEIEVIAAC